MQVMKAPSRQGAVAAGPQKNLFLRLRRIVIKSNAVIDEVKRRKTSPYTEADVIRARAETGLKLKQMTIVKGKSVKYGLCFETVKTIETVVEAPRFVPLVDKLHGESRLPAGAA